MYTTNINLFSPLEAFLNAINKRSICIIEDEVDILDTLKLFLESQNFRVYGFGSAEEFFKNIPEKFTGLYLVDWNLPGESGLSIIEKIRKTDLISPIFMVSAYNRSEDIVVGLKAGADDYISKPFSMDELSARVENALSKFSHIKTELDLDEMKLLPEAKSFIRSGTTISLTSREFLIFNMLYENFSIPITRDELLDCFDKDDEMTIRNIDVHIFSLRKKIKNVNLVIETMWGKGYKLLELS